MIATSDLAEALYLEYERANPESESVDWEMLSHQKQLAWIAVAEDAKRLIMYSLFNEK